MENLHIVLQYLLLLIWIVTTARLIINRKVLTLDLLSLSLAASVLMIYIISTNLTLYNHTDTVIWNRFEWYFFDVVTALTVNKTINTALKINKTLNCFANKNKHG